MSKRTELRERRAKSRRRRMGIYLGIVAIASLFVMAMILYPNVAPVGEVAAITPFPRPQADGRSAGDPDAPVTIEVYEDFQCPACAAFAAQTERQLMDEYVGTGKAVFIFRHFPFLEPAPGGESTQASNASMCAAEQGRFWDYHDMLFANQTSENRGAFSDRRLEAIAETIGLDMDAFRACFDEDRYRQEIDADELRGLDLGVNATPSIAVNGALVQDPDPRLVPSYELIAAAIDSALQPAATTP